MESPGVDSDDDGTQSERICARFIPQKRGIIHDMKLTVTHENWRHGHSSVLIVDGNHRVSKYIQLVFLYSGHCDAPDSGDDA